MSTTLFYFSGTGNSLKVTRDLAAQLGDTSIISIPKAINSDILINTDVVGVIYPVYMFGMPLIVNRFLQKLKNAEGKYLFAIATCGGMAANALGKTSRELKRQGLKLSAGFIVRMPGNYTPLYEAIPENKQKAMFEEERVRIKDISEIIHQKQICPPEHQVPLLSWLFSGIYKLGSPRIPSSDKNFWADQNCNNCGMCVKVCPVGNIELIEGKPGWLHHCEQCFGCLQWCPQKAIQYKKSTVGRKRYQHPDINVEDIIQGA